MDSDAVLSASAVDVGIKRGRKALRDFAPSLLPKIEAGQGSTRDTSRACSAAAEARAKKKARRLSRADHFAGPTVEEKEAVAADGGYKAEADCHWRKLDEVAEKFTADRRRGASVTEVDSWGVIASVRCVHDALPELFPTKVYELVARNTGMSLPTIRTIMGVFVVHGEVYVTDHSRKGRPRGLQITDAHQKFLHEFTQDRLKAGTTSHRKDMLSALRAEFGEGVTMGFVARLTKAMDLKNSPS